MKYIARDPCAECSFRKTSLKGGLGADTPEEVWQKVHMAENYPCHVTLEGLPHEDDGTIDPNNPKIEQCAGAILHATKTCKIFSNPDAEKLRRDMKKRKPFDVLGFEFVEHHKQIGK